MSVPRVRSIRRPGAFSLLATAIVATSAAAQTPRLLLDARTGAPGSMATSIYSVTPSPRAGEVFLVLDDFAHGSELWRSDGTTAGTRLVLDLTPGPAGTVFTNFRASHDGLWFVVQAPSGSELWRSDGSAAGTRRVLDANNIGATALGVPEYRLPDGTFLLTIDGSLWRSNGTDAGTLPLGLPEGAIYPAGGTRFWVWDYVTSQLWSSDGTSGGSTLVLAGVTAAAPALGGLVVAQAGISSTVLSVLGVTGVPSITLAESAFLFVLDGVPILLGTATLWRWDGGNAATVLGSFASLRDPTGSFTLAIGAERRAMMFMADDGSTGFEPWWSDLTAAGTRRIVDLTPGPASTPTSIGFWLGDRAVFWATTTAFGSEPWTTDGTPGGTSLLGDLEPGPGSSTPDLFAGVGGLASQRRVVFPIQTTTHGNEPWVSDGTSAGTRMLADVNPGPASSLQPFGYWAWHAGATLVLALDDGVHGYEPHAIALEGAASPLYGACSGAPRFQVGDPVLGSAWQLAASGVAQGGVAVLALPAASPIAAGHDCLLQIDPATSVLLAAITPNAQGHWSASVALPNLPSLRGGSFVTQAAFVPSSHPLGVALGTPWFLTLGY